MIGAVLLTSISVTYAQAPVADDATKAAATPAAADASTAKPSAAAPKGTATTVTVEPAGPAAEPGNSAPAPPASAPSATPASAGATASVAVATPPAPVPPPAVNSSTGYIACLGCPEHEELKNHWKKAWKYAVVSHALVAGSSIALEAHGRSLGMCEQDPLMRSSVSYNGCHPFSWSRTLTLAVPIEVLAFTSPSWGLSRWGHSRIGTSIELIPIALHLRAIIRTSHSINQLQAQQPK
jgi:hypothetical protein